MTISRRSFISGIVAGSAAAGAAFASERTNAAGLCSIPTKWDQTWDVIVIGAGGAGFAAGITRWAARALMRRLACLTAKARSLPDFMQRAKSRAAFTAQTAWAATPLPTSSPSAALRVRAPQRADA